MTASGELFILDVGHGNCAILKTPNGVVVVDAPSEPTVPTMLDSLGITSIEMLIISHADSDHLSGAISLMMDTRRPIASVHANPDGRNSNTWYRFRAAAKDASSRGTRVHATLNRTDPGIVAIGETTVEVLHPTPWGCLGTVDGNDLAGRRQNPNSMSGVVLIKHCGLPVCLLAGDADANSLASMLDENAALAASVLVFPHHGGHSSRGRNNAERRQQNQSFAEDFTRAVSPDLVLFSLGRNKHKTPQPEIVSGVRRVTNILGSPAHVACTQLSVNCAVQLTGTSHSKLDERSAGCRTKSCCSGTLTVPLDAVERKEAISKFKEAHSEFVNSHVNGALCRKAIHA